MEQLPSNNVNRASIEPRNQGGAINSEGAATQNLPARPPLTRADSRSAFPPQSLRLGAPQLQQRPQFQPGTGTSQAQFAPRPTNPAQRGQAPVGPPGSPQIRGQQPILRPLGPQQFTSQGPRPIQSPTFTQPPQRGPVPNNLQFGPRQPPQFGNVTTPEGSRPPVPPSNGSYKNGSALNAPINAQITSQPIQGPPKSSDSINSIQNKPVNLENQTASSENQNGKPENAYEVQGAVKGRSYSIAAAPGAPSPLKTEDDRRKSVSAVGGRYDELTSRSPGLSLIQEMKGSKDNILGSKESVRSEASNDGAKDIPERPESRLNGSKMTESFMGSLSNLSSKKKGDDDDDVIAQSNPSAAKLEITQNKTDLSDRSPSLTRSDDSPEPKAAPQPPVQSKKSPVSTTPEPQRPKTPKSDKKPEVKQEPAKDIKPKETPTKNAAKSPIYEAKSPINSKPVTSANQKPTELKTPVTPHDSKKSTPRKIVSAPASRSKDGDNDSGVDESTQGNDLNGSPSSPNKKLPSKLPTKEKSSSSLKQSLSRSSSKSATAKTPETPQPGEKKKVPMNKVQVGSAPSPNIKAVKSKIGSLENTTYKPGGGKVKIENRKLDFNNVTPKIAAKNDAYTPSGGAKKITTTKLEWNAKSKIGSLQNAAYKPGGGDKKIETVKLDFKEKAKPKVASTVNITHKPGGGTIKIENQKLEFKAQSKVGSLDNVKHKPGGGDIKIFDDKDYIKQIGGVSPQPSGVSRQESPVPPSTQASKADENLNQQQF
ncbi:microtubule-associated protein tau isoform X1 [Danaus plexippus]|uniref:microtubule-associated protein tau isoform X1 n=1 Tax=Danaus plexippus TaxID=13037 RepID=UPI0013C43FA6|nr:microtubule-associated protein tau isoform X1 [Danaus plexippus]